LVDDARNGHFAAKALAKVGYVDASLGAERDERELWKGDKMATEPNRVTYTRWVSSSVE
jgi:hypothetical protein